MTYIKYLVTLNIRLRGGENMSYIDPCAPACGAPAPVFGFWTTTGTILVLYILLVIILRAPFA
jgi:hypothetical protein